MPYLVLWGSVVDAEFATPDAAYDYAKRASTKGKPFLKVRSGKGLGSTLRCYVQHGALYAAVPCKDCKGSGTSDHGSTCYGCYGDGAKIGEAVP